MKDVKYFKCATIGGTFNSFHKGHAEYIDIAFGIAEIVYIHVISDILAKKKKNYSITSYAQRVEKIESYLKEKKFLDRSRIFPITGGHALENNLLNLDFDVAVVEPAYFNLFGIFNKKRIELGKKKFCIIYKPRTVDMQGNDISSTIIETERLLKQASET